MSFVKNVVVPYGHSGCGSCGSSSCSSNCSGKVNSSNKSYNVTANGKTDSSSGKTN